MDDVRIGVDVDRDASAAPDGSAPLDASGEMDAGADGDTTDAADDGDVTRDGSSEFDAEDVVSSEAVDAADLDGFGSDAGLDGARGPVDAASDGPPAMPVCGDAGCAALGQLFAGDDFNCVRSVSGAVACWGANDRGQLGRGTITPLVGGAGGEHTPLSLSLPMTTVLGVGASHACAATVVGMSPRVWCWGDNRDGALGVGPAGDAVTVATPVVGFSPATAVSKLTLGQRTSFVFVGRELHAWGANPDGTLGLPGAPAVVSSPRMLASALRAGVASAHSQGFCWLDNRVASCVGVNRGGRFGAGVALEGILATPTELPAPYHSEALALSNSFACRIDRAEVACWGQNLSGGALGAIPAPGDPSVILAPRPVPLGGERIEELAAGADFVLARSAAGSVFCWGSNAEGQCATGSLAVDRTVAPAATGPVRVSFPPEFAAPARAIAAGRSHACALDATGAVWCWGRNSHGQVGEPWSDDPATRRWLQPVRVPVFGR